MAELEINESIVFQVGSFILLESGEYSDRYNLGLFRVIKQFQWADIPLKDKLYIDRGYRRIGTVALRQRNMTKEFVSEHLEGVDCYEMNVDHLRDQVQLTPESPGLSLGESMQLSRIGDVNWKKLEN